MSRPGPHDFVESCVLILTSYPWIDNSELWDQKLKYFGNEKGKTQSQEHDESDEWLTRHGICSRFAIIGLTGPYRQPVEGP